MSRSTRRAVRDARREFVRARGTLTRLEGRSANATVTTASWRRHLVVAVLVVAVLVAAVAVGWRWTRPVYTDADYLDSAAATVGLLLLPDARDTGRAERILARSTGSFRDEFAQSAGGYRDLVGRLQTAASGTVDGVAISGRHGDRVDALVTAAVATRANTGADSSDPSARRFRLLVTIEPDDGSLKLANLTVLP